MNSARLAGGMAPLPRHSILPEAQSPVRQENFPVESVEQKVRPQIRPDQEFGADRVLDLPGLRVKPVGFMMVLSAPVRIPGHTVYLHLFTILNDVASTSEIEEIVMRIGRIVMRENPICEMKKFV